MLFVTAMVVTLVVGDFASTFFYHIPQHLWFTLHLRTHHDRKRSYWDHTVLSRSPEVLLDGLLGAIPYIVIAIACGTISVYGAALGLLLGQMHVWWRHTSELGWKSPAWMVAVARPRRRAILSTRLNPKPGTSLMSRYGSSRSIGIT